MMKNRSLLPRLLGFCFSILLLLGGIFLLRLSAPIPGAIALATGAILFIVLEIYNEKQPPAAEEAQALKPYLVTALFWIASLTSMSLVVRGMSNWSRPVGVNRWIAVGWLSSLLCAVLGMLFAVRWRPAWKRFLENIKRNRAELLVVSALFLASLLCRVNNLDDHPFPWSGDEASVGIEASRLLSGELTDLFSTGWSGQPDWSFLPTAVSLAIFGKNFFAIRLVSAIEGTLAVLFLYLLGREFSGRGLATLAAGFLAAFSYHVHFSRIGVNNIIDSMLVCCVLWLSMRAIRTGRISSFFWAGLAGGLAFYTYVGSRLVPVLAAFVLLQTLLRQRGAIKVGFIRLGIFLLAAILVITPLGYYFINYKDNFMTRLGQENIFMNGWLAGEMQRTGASLAGILWKQFTDTVLVYISQPSVGNFFNSSQPYLSILGAFFFILGMVYALLKIKEARMLSLLVWFWTIILLGGVLTLSPPANTRLLMTSPAVAIFVALGITQFTGILSRMNLFSGRWQAIISVGLVIILGIQNLAYYFGSYRARNNFQDATGEFTQVAGLELKGLGPGYDYYLFGLPRIFAAFPTVEFLCPGDKMTDLNSGMIETLALEGGKSNFFAAIPENRSDLELIREKYPGGTWEEVRRRYQNETLYFAYILP